MLTAAGVGSGLDIESMISQLVALERRPIERLEASKSAVALDISANGQLRSAIARFQGAVDALAEREALGAVRAASSDESVLGASAAAGAAAQVHEIEVVQLATAHRIASNAYADADTSIGSGTLDVTVGTSTLRLTLDADNSSLAQIRDAINAAPDNPGVTASVIHVDAGSRLVLGAASTGAANAVSVSAGGGLTGITTTEVAPARDALLRVDGLDAGSASNTANGVLDGVTLELAAPGTATVSLGADDSRLSEAVQELVDAFNGLRGNMKALGRNAFAGDGVLLGLERGINQRLGAPIELADGSRAHLFEAGVSFDDEGDLVFDAARLAAGLAADPARILDTFGAEGGLAATLAPLLEGYLAEDGILDTRVDTLRDRDRVLDRRIASVEFRLEKTEARLREQFTALDSLLARLTVTSDFLSQQLLSLPSANRGSRS